ncbi:MAG TPA: flagellar biosynthetic protein FliR [Terracidiphilus sp.]|jgi:flagellar biosynthetic protein FliR
MIQIPLLPLLGAFFAIGVRITGLMLFAPFFGSAVIPNRVKAVFVLALTVLLMPSVGAKIGTHTLGEWPLIVLTEFAIGVGIGVVTNVIFEAVQLSGQVLGVQMGYSLVNILDPQTQVDTTVMSIFYQSIVMLLFLRMDVHLWLLRAVGNSFDYLPVGTAHITGLFTAAVFRVAGSIFGLGVQIAAPVLSATLAADIVLGFLGKASPQMPIMLLGPAVKSLLGLAILIATLKYWPDLFRRLFMETMSQTNQLLHLAH